MNQSSQIHEIAARNREILIKNQKLLIDNNALLKRCRELSQQISKKYTNAYLKK